MNDLRLWRLLRQQDPPPAELAPLLRELAALPVRDRLPFFGLLPRALGHADAEVRAAAASCLGQVGGSLGFRQLVRVLHAPELPVRLAAAEALREAAAHDPPRWAHALFHHDAEVRRFAALADNAPLPAWYGLYLLPDPACAPGLLPRLQGHRPPGHTLPLILDHLHRGLLSRTVAASLLAAMSWQECLQGLDRCSVRDDAQVGAVLAEAARPDGGDRLRADLPADSLEDVLDLFWAPATDGATGEDCKRFFEQFTAGLFGLSPEQVRRVVAALLVTAARRGAWNERAAGPCAVFHPEMLLYPWIPREQRYRALRGFYSLGTRCPGAEPEEVRPLLATDLFRRPSGKLDLWAVGALLHRLKRNPYEQLQEWVTLDEIVAAFLEDMEHAVPFFCLADDSPRGRQFLINKVGQRLPSRRALLAALLIHAVSADALDFLAPLDARGAVEVFAELARFGGRPGMTLSAGKMRCLGEILAGKVARAALGDFLAAWLKLPAPEELDLGLRVLGELSRTLEADELTDAALRLNAEPLRKLLVAIGWCAGFPYGKELHLAQALAGHKDPEVREWARGRLGAVPPAPAPRAPRPADGVVRFPEYALAIIGRCDEGGLRRELVVRHCLQWPSAGLAQGLARRPPPAASHQDVCLALLACHDPVEVVAEQFARFASEDAEWLGRLDERAVGTWGPEMRLPLLGHAWLYRWEEHNFAFYRELCAHWPAGLPDALPFLGRLPARVLARRTWEAVALLLGMWRWRDKPAFQSACTEATGAALLDALDSDLGGVAAQILVLFHEGGGDPELVARWRVEVAARLPDLTPEVRRVLQFWVDATGLAGAGGPRRRTKAPDRAELLPRIRTCIDLDQLELWCGLEDEAVVEEAALRLLELGEVGAARLADLLGRTPPPPLAATLAATVSLWPDGPALQRLRALVHDPGRPGELRFLAGAGLVKRGESGLVEVLLDAVCAEGGPNWFRPEHWRELLGLGLTERQLSLRLAASPQPHAYSPAVRHLTARARRDERARAALTAFLEAGTGRMRELRLLAAGWLHAQGDEAGFPLLLQNEHQAEAPKTPNLLAGLPAELVEVTVTAGLVAGPGALSERVVLDLLRAEGVDEDARGEGLVRLLADGTSEPVKTLVLGELPRGKARARKLEQVAETFAWGVRQGRELTGRLFAVEMLAGEQLGYTRFTQNRIYINALPILRQQANARDVVEGLIVHELGHHMYHRGPEPEAVWKRAGDEGLFKLLNLVSDEHLERNLRALDGEHGDRLKRLAAHAFLHADRELALGTLLDGLQGRALEVLTATRLNAARRPERVAVQSGQLLLEMERAGLSFARFFRALRMGLGNRHHDPKVAEALALFRGKFRQSSMEDLYVISKRLREIFGWEVQALDALGQDEALAGDASEALAEGEGIGNDEVQREVERILNPRKGPRREKEDGPPRLCLNVSPEEQFEPIRTVVPVPYDAKEHARYAREVALPARQMRRYLAELGLTLRPQRMRLSGKSFDRTRVQALTTRGDPRVLIAREHRIVTDLFLGIVIDCSGSMQTGENIEKAKRFGVLLAEAARGLEGIDVRVLGFTDSVIYDAGDSGRCAAHGLHAGGGNNDAAGLWHAAQAALGSRRKAKLLVMISDGLPTECSVAALRGLVKRLTLRFKMCCAQVAVRPLEEICFPNYVLLEESDPGKSVRRFGAVVARLVRKALRG
jgi:hypothetical protein